MDRLENVATPPLVVTLVVPDSVPPPGLVPIATVMDVGLAVVTVLPNWSCTATCTAGLIATPAVAAEGWTANPTLVAAAAVMLKVALVALSSGAEVACRV